VSRSRWRLSPLVAGILAVAVLGGAVLVGVVLGDRFGGTGPSVGDAEREVSVPPLGPRPGTGPEMPAFNLARFDGEGRIALEDFEGTPVVLNFWASWCPFCIEEMPGFERVHQRFQGSVAFLGVSMRESSRSLAEDLVERTGVTYELAEDPEGSLFTEVGAFGMPTTLFITADGRLAERFGGPLREEQLEDLILEHLVEEAR
jgi:cytochrome c biogenesis protein CcmG, thiol:disulfide interchange protein DsbE